jgi:predicted metal-dependent phosphoesterase TrpH
MLADLHTHSDRSDGTDPPAKLVRRARQAGLDVVALTDHDSADGWADAAGAAAEEGIGFVPGIEISCRHRGAGVHLLAYLPDPAYQPLADVLRAVLAGRNARLPAIISQLRAAGVDISEADVRRVAGATTALGRPHVADALVDGGVVADRAQGFDEYLAPGRPGYVDRYAADLPEMLSLVRAAGGASVVAHPWGRQSRRVLGEEDLAGLGEHGLVGIEVDHQDHDVAARAALRAIARNLDLVVTGSSDYHGTGKVGHPLGCNTTDPDQLARLLDAAREAAARAGRGGCQPVLP